MIRALTSRPTLTPDSVCAVRLLSAYENYAAYPFAHFWEDGEGRYASMIDGTAVFYAETVTEEWLTFWQMQPDLAKLITDACIGETVAAHLGRPFSQVPVMKSVVPSNGQAEPVAPKAAFELMTRVFGDAIPPFDVWYADVSHRMRHAGCQTVGVMRNGVCVSCAMTVAECDGGALIGAVATAETARRQGLAGRLVGGLAATLSQEQKQVFICPKHEAARRLYERIGFVVCGGVITI